MKSLVYKELGETLVPAACLFVPLLVFWFAAASPRDVLMNPQQEPAAAVLATAGFAGLLIGYCQFAAERWRKTLGYVLHRGTSDGHVFVAKVITGLCATEIVALGPMIEFALWHRLTSPEGPILQLQRIVELAWLSTLGVSAYALGALASQLHRAWWKEASLALVGGAALVIIAVNSTIMTPDDPALPWLRYVVIQVGIGIVLLAIAFRLFVSRGDRDLPLPSLTHAVLALIGIVLFVLPLDLGTAIVENSWTRLVRNEYPTLLRERATNRVLAVVPTERGEYVEVDAARRSVPNAAPLSWSERSGRDEAYELVHRLPWTRSVDLGDSLNVTTLNGRWTNLQFLSGGTPVSTIAAANGQFIPGGYLDLHAGVIRVFFTEFQYGEPLPRPDVVLPRALPMELVIDKPRANRRFSGHTVCLDALAQRSTSRERADDEPPTYRALCAVDLDDRSMWRIDPLDLRAPVSEVTLPDGDRFVQLEFADRAPSRVRPAFFSDVYAGLGASGIFAWRAGRASLIVSGERGLYAWNGDRFEPFTRDPSAVAARELEVSIFASNAAGVETDSDPLEPSVTVRSADGSEVLFTYDHAPSGFRERITVALIYLTNLVRSPLGCVISFFSTSREGTARPVASGWARIPLLVNGHRPVLLFAVLALALLATRKMTKSLVQRGTDRRTIGVWALLTAVFGVYAYVLFRIFEPRGTPFGVSESSASEPVPMLIESRATASAHVAGSS